jgi:hypothetical protein
MCPRPAVLLNPLESALTKNRGEGGGHSHIGIMVLDNGLSIDESIEQVFNYPTRSKTYQYAAYDGLGNLAGHKLREG